MDTQKTTPNSNKLNALLERMKATQAVIAAPVVPVAEEKKSEETPPRPTPYVNPKQEARRQAEEIFKQAQKELAEAAEQMFSDFDGLQEQANDLRFKRSRTAIEDAQLTALDRKIISITEGFVDDINVFEIWVGGHLDRADEYRVSTALVERGILEQISAEEKSEMVAKRQAYFALPEEDRRERDLTGQYKNPYPENFWTVRGDPGDEGTTCYFKLRRYSKEEWREKGQEWQSEYRRLSSAYETHHKRVREEARERKAAMEAAAAERREQEEALVDSLDFQVDGGRSLEDMADLKPCSNPKQPPYPYMVKVVLAPEHQWRMYEGGKPLTGFVYLLCLGKATDEPKETCGRIQFMGSTGGIRHYLFKKGVEAGTVCQYEIGKQFAGIRGELSGEDMGFLRALFLAAMGYKKTHRETPQNFNPILLAAAQQEGKGGSHQKQRGERRHNAGGEGVAGGDDGPKKGPGRRRQRGGAQNLLQKYLPYGKV
ncbi:MAG: hypothetical protein HYT37_01180 [Candidatus Sungbacteria bacterium]|nr:hypothetical protein [Candidatus Sungbacteria bacterium]